MITQVDQGAVQAVPVEWTATSFRFERKPTIAEFVRQGLTLKRIHGGYQWWVGDWYREGEMYIGEDLSQYLFEMDYELQTVRNWAWICGQFERSRRREFPLTISHHAEVAKEDNAIQNLILDWAGAYIEQHEDAKAPSVVKVRKAKKAVVKYLDEVGRLPDIKNIDDLLDAEGRERWERVSVEEFINEDGEICRRIIERKVA